MVFGCFTRLAAKLTEDTLNAFFGRVQFLFNFATEKFVIIKDWRLGLILRVLQVAILIYVLTDIIRNASYLLPEVPKGVVSPAANVPGKLRRESVQDQRDRYNNEELAYCRGNGAEYEYEFSNVTYNDFQCVVMDALAIPVQGESKFFVTTYFRLDKIYYVSVPSGSKCPNADDSRLDIPNDAERFGKFFDVCVFNTVEQYFAIDPEAIPLSILHSYYTSVVDKNGATPETIISGDVYDDGGEERFDDGDLIQVTTADLLRIAGVDLDKRLDEQPNTRGLTEASRDSSDRDYPFARLSGVNLIMTFKYFHRALAPSSVNVVVGPKSRDVICLVEIAPQYTWTVEGSDVLYQISGPADPFLINPARTRLPVGADPVVEGVQVDYQRYGIQLTFQVSGNLGKFDFFSLVDALVAGAVLLSVAQIIVTYVALYALGLSSQLYMEFMRESVNWRREYARFAAQALVGGTTFNSFDKNNSGALDRTEIYTHLTQILGGDILTPPQLACLTDFLMRHGEMDADVSKGRLDDVSDVKLSTINTSEWIDIFTEEKVQLNSLTRLVDSEYSDDRIIGILLRLAEGRNVRGLSHLMSGDTIELGRDQTRSEQAEHLLQETGSTSEGKGPKPGDEGDSKGDDA